MPLTRGLGSGGVRSARACLVLGAWGVLVTGCGTEPRMGSLGAAGGQSEPLGAEAGAGGAGAPSAGAPSAGAGGAARTGAARAGAGAPSVRIDVPSAGSGSEGETNHAGGSSGVEAKHYPGQGFIVHEWG